VRELSPGLQGYLWATYLAAGALVVGAGAALVAWGPLVPAHRALWPAVAVFAALVLFQRTLFDAAKACDCGRMANHADCGRMFVGAYHTRPRVISNYVP